MGDRDRHRRRPERQRRQGGRGLHRPAGTPAPQTGGRCCRSTALFDQPVEQVYAQIPLSEIDILSDGSHVFSVRGLDAAGNWGALGTGTLQIDKTGPVITSATLTPASRQRGQSTTLNATAADGSLVDRFEYFLDLGPATSVTVTAGSPRSITRSITVPVQTSGQLHYVFVRAHDGAGNWGAWTQLALTVTNAFGPLSLPEDLGPVAGIVPLAAPVAAPVIRNKAGGIAVRATGQARLVSVKSAGGAVRARFAFAPHGIQHPRHQDHRARSRRRRPRRAHGRGPRQRTARLPAARGERQQALGLAGAGQPPRRARSGPAARQASHPLPGSLSPAEGFPDSPMRAESK